jgi:acetoacetyl-CoA synthetase
MEVPIKKLMLGQALARVASADAMANPLCLSWYQDFARQHLQRGAVGPAGA